MSGTDKHSAAGEGDRDDLTAAQLLRSTRELRDQASAAGSGYWLALLLFGILICGSLPFYERLRSSRPGAGLAAPGSCRAAVGHPCHIAVGAVHLTAVAALGYYWQLAIPAGVVLTVLWYRWRGNRVGLRTPTRGFLITGLILGELVLLLPLLAAQSGSLTSLMRDTHQAGPLVIIAVLLWVLAWAERSPALAVITAAYLVAALVVSRFTDSGLAGGTTGAADLSLAVLRLLGLLPALILLVAGAGTWLARRRHGPPHGAAGTLSAA
jgi:hypothetical protein